jgi:restriction system protein
MNESISKFVYRLVGISLEFLVFISIVFSFFSSRSNNKGFIFGLFLFAVVLWSASFAIRLLIHRNAQKKDKTIMFWWDKLRLSERIFFRGTVLILGVMFASSYYSGISVALANNIHVNELPQFVSLITDWIAIGVIIFYIFDWRAYRKLNPKERKSLNWHEILKQKPNYARMYRESKIEEIDRMEGRQFEEFMAGFFEAQGFRVILTQASGDYGADLVITNSNGFKTAVQLKRYSSSVGVSAVQEAISGKSYYGTDHAMVVTTNYFTNNAKELASVSRVELWDRDRLVQELYKITNQQTRR